MATDSAHEELARGSIDLVIGVKADSLSQLHIERMYQEPFLCLVRRDSCQSNRLSFAECCDRPHLDVSPTGRKILGACIDNALRQIGGKRTVAATISSFMAAPSIVGASEMICLMPKKMAMAVQHSPNVAVVELDFQSPVLEIVMYWHNVTQQDAVCKWLRQQLLSRFGSV